MGAIFGGVPKPPPPPPPPPAPPDPEVEERKRRLEALERRRRGRAGMIATSERGLLDTVSPSATGKKEHLGD